MHRMSYSDFDRNMKDRREILGKIEGFSLVIQPYCTAQFARLSSYYSQASRMLYAQFCESGPCMRRGRNKVMGKKEE
jgi:hypothetical protein